MSRANFGTGSERIRWGWLIALLAAPAAAAAAMVNAAAYAYDAASVHIFRGVLFSQAITDGVLYPRWVQFLHGGLGSPLFTFQGPLTFYLLDLFYRIGIPHHLGWRVLIGGGLLLACAGAYLLGHALTGSRWAGVACAVAYVYAPYILRNAYERGSPEAFSVFLYPWVLWGFIRLGQRPSAGRFVLATLLWGACIGPHVLGPLMLAPVAALVCLVLLWRNRTWLPLGSFVAGILLAAAIWLPTLEEQQYVQVERDFSSFYAEPARNPIPTDRLLAPPVLYDVTRGNNGTGDRMGLPQAAFLILAVPACLWAVAQGRRRLALILGLSALVGLGIFWLFTSASDPVWHALDSSLGRIQYRSRLMGVQALVASVALAALLALFRGRTQRWLAWLAIGSLIAVSLSPLYVALQNQYAVFDRPQTLADVRAAEVKQGLSGLTSFAEFLPRWRTAPLGDVLLQDIGADHDSALRPFLELPAGVQVIEANVLSDSWDVTLESQKQETLTLGLLYYPRWRAAIDGVPAELRPQDETGYAQLDVPQGEHRIRLRYGSTLAENTALAVTGLTALGLVFLAGYALLRAWRRESPRIEDPSQSAAEADASNGPPRVWPLLALTAFLLLKVGFVDPSTTWFRCVSTSTRVCGAEETLDVPFADAPSLRGYTLLTPQPKHGETLRLNLYWQSSEKDSRPLQSFVHVRNSQKDWPMRPDTGNEIWAQDEHVTPGGLLASEFVPGKLYLDEFRVRLPDEMPPGEYYLEIGWFDPATGEQIEPVAEAVKPPYGILWRSILLPNIVVE